MQDELATIYANYVVRTLDPQFGSPKGGDFPWWWVIGFIISLALLLIAASNGGSL